MKISDILGMSLMNLWRRKTRTVLTVLGVIIGTASIVVMLSLGIGLRESMLEQVGTAGGLTEIMVSSDADYGTDDLLLSDSTIELFYGIDHVEKVEPQIWYSMPVQAGKYENMFTIIGVSDEYLANIELEQGELPQAGGTLSMIAGNQVITEFMDVATGEWTYYESDELPNVDMLTTPMVGGIEKEESYTADNMDNDRSDTGGYSDPTFALSSEDNENENEDNFGTEEDFSMDEDDSDDFFREEYEDDSMSYSYFSPSMKRVPVKVTGVTAGDAESYSEYSYYCYTRLDVLKDFLKQNYSLNEVIPGQPTDRDGKPYRDLKYSQITVKVDESNNVEDVLQTIQSMGYRAEANKEWLEEIEKEFMIIEAVLGGIGAVSMLVAAISIANTMTMSIYERTKEIGIMKVLGCGLGNIRSMFLSEAAFIGFLGGLAGIGLSYLLSMVVNQVAPSFVGESMDLAEGASISRIPPWLVLLAIIFSTIIGMVAGFFPAQRATKLSPLAAIRNE
ncbi:MAG: ABC transporter permease [Clostridium sp.]|nr:ABC transporter permease [Clostridium sp.]